LGSLNFSRRLGNAIRKGDKILDFVIIVLPLALLVIAPLMWFGGFEGKTIFVGDSYFPIDPKYGLSSNLFTWEDQYGGGSYNDLLPNLPVFFTVRILYQLFPLWITQLIFFMMLTIITFLSFFFLAKTVFALSGVNCSKKASLSSSVLSAFLYTFNPYMLNIWYMQYLNLIFFVAFLPLALACFLILLRELRCGGQNAIKWLLLSLFASIPLSIVDLPDFLLFLVLVIFFGIYYSVAIPDNRKSFLSRFTKYFFLFIVLIILVNVWWWPNYFIHLFSCPQIDWRLGESAIYFFKLYTKPSTLVELFRFLGDISFYTPNSIPSGSIYVENPIFIPIGFIISLLSSIALLPKKRERKSQMLLVYFFAIIYLLSIFFVKGINPPFGNVTLYLFENIPILQIFRAPWRRLMGFALLSLCTLFAFSMHRFLNSRISKIIKVFALVMLILFGWSQISGDIFSSVGVPTTNGVTLEPARAKVPEYYYSAANYINRQPETFSIMLLPFDSFYASLSWGYHASWSQLNIFQKPIVNLGITVQEPSGNIGKVLGSVISELYTKPSFSNGQILSLLFNVKYVLLLRDWDTEYEPFTVARVSPDDVAELLPSAGFSLEMTFGNVSIYRNSYWTKDNSVYAANAIANDNQLYDQIMPYYENAYSFLNPESNIVFMQPDDVANISEVNRMFMEGNQSTLLNDDQTTFWSARANSTILTDDINIKISGSDSLKIFVPKDSTVAFWWINHNFMNFNGSLQDWSERDYISFYWYGQNTGATISLAVYATYPNCYEFTFVDDFLGWRNMAFPFSKFVAHGSPSFKRVEQLQFYCLTAYTSGTWHLDMIEIGNGPFVQVSEFKRDEVKIVTKKINPTKYAVNINATNPFILVLGQSYNPNWQVYIDGMPSNFKHYQVNGYQNAWYINKTGEYAVTIEYWPQEIFYIGLAISSLTLVVCASVLTMCIEDKKAKLKSILVPLYRLSRSEGT
jgi:hypothetical protein